MRITPFTAFAMLCLFLIPTAIFAESLVQKDFPISAANSLQSRPSLTYNSVQDQFLVTWTDTRNKNSSGVDIYGRIINPKGNPVGKEFPITRGKRGQGNSSIAYDSINNRYLAVWSDWRNAGSVDSDIYGQFLQSNGSLFDKEFPITKLRVSQKQPAVGFDPAHKRFLVVWKDRRDHDVEKLFGQFIDTQGKFQGEEFTVAKGVGKQDRPSLHYDSKRKRFLVVWRDIVDEQLYLTTPLRGKGIFSALVDPEAKTAIQSNIIDIEEDACLPPSLYAASYSPEDDVFLVVWTTARDYQKNGLDVYGAFVQAADGKRRGPAFPIAVESDYQEFPSVVYDQQHKRFLVVWYDLRRDKTALNQDVYGRYIQTTGKAGKEFIISDNNARGIRRYPAIAFSSKSETSLIIWEDSRKKTQNFHSQRIYGKLW